MFTHGSCVTVFLVAYIGRFHQIKNCYDMFSFVFVTVNDLGQFVKAPRGRCIVLTEHDQRDSGSFDCLKKSGTDFVAAPQTLIVSEGVDSVTEQSSVEVIGECVASPVFALETHKNIIRKIFMIRHELNQCSGFGKRSSSVQLLVNFQSQPMLKVISMAFKIPAKEGDDYKKLNILFLYSFFSINFVIRIFNQTLFSISQVSR